MSRLVLWGDGNLFVERLQRTRCLTKVEVGQAKIVPRIQVRRIELGALFEVLFGLWIVLLVESFASIAVLAHQRACLSQATVED